MKFSDGEESAVWASLRQQDHELVATKSRNRVNLSGTGCKQARHTTKKLITRFVTQIIVYALEVIDIDIRQGKRAIKSLGANCFPLKDLHQPTAVRDAGQEILARKSAFFREKSFDFAQNEYSKEKYPQIHGRIPVGRGTVPECAPIQQIQRQHAAGTRHCRPGPSSLRDIPSGECYRNEINRRKDYFRSRQIFENCCGHIHEHT